MVICIDSAAVPFSLQTINSIGECLMFETVQCLFRIHRLAIDAELCWVPAHVGLKGSEYADRMAKRNLNTGHVFDIPFERGDGKAIIKSK